MCARGAITDGDESRRRAARPGCSSATVSASTGTSLLARVHIVVLLLLGLVAGGAAQQGTGSPEFRVCLDFGTRNTGFYLSPSMSVAYTLAAEHIATRNCTYVPDCAALLSEGTVRVEFETWHTSARLVDSAAAAMECSAWGGHLYVLGPNSLVETVVPINTVNRVVTASAVLSRSTRIMGANFFRTHHPASLEAQNLVNLASYFVWDRVLVLYDEGAAEFVEAMVEYGQELGVEVGAFSVGTDFSSKMNAILEFGSSIVMLPTFSDFEGEPEHLHKALRLCEEKGLLDPEFTWIGSYHLSRTFFVFDDDSEDDRRLQKLITSMIFHRVVPVVLPAATELWDDHAESAVVSAVLEGQFEELVDDTVWWAEAKGQFLTEFAVAYDTMWLAASAFSKCGGGKSIGLEGADLLNDTWITCLEDVSFTGTSGYLHEEASMFRESNNTGHYGELFVVNQDDNGHHLHVPIARFHMGNYTVDFVEGQSEIPWRDGSSYPNSIPFADIRTDEAGASKDALYGSIGAMVVMLVLLLLVCAGYSSLRKELNTIAVMKLDVDSPVVKAVQLLQVVSRRMIVTKTVREQALRIAMSLSHAENVHAPDLSAQTDNANSDIMTYLMFRNTAGAKSSEHDKSRRDGGAVKATGNGDMEIQEIGDGNEDDGYVMRGEECIDAAIGELVPKEVMPFVETAGEDLFFNTSLLAEYTGGKPLLCACLQVSPPLLLSSCHSCMSSPKPRFPLKAKNR